MKTTLLGVMLLAMLTSHPSAEARINCPDAPQQISTDTKAKVDVAVGKLAKISAAQASIDVTRTTRDLLENIPQADRLYLEQMMFAAFCTSVRDSSSLTDLEKAIQLRSYAQDVRRALSPNSSPSPLPKPKADAQSPTDTRPATKAQQRTTSKPKVTSPIPASAPRSEVEANAPKPAESRFRPRVALIVANWQYKHIFTGLRAPVEDAKVIESALRSHGFQTLLLLNTTKSKLEAALTQFRHLLTFGGIGVVYYSGGGFGLGSRAFIVPVDAQPPNALRDLVASSIDVTAFLKPLESPLAKTPVSSGEVLAFASEGISYDAMPGSATSPFTTALREALESQDTGLDGVLMHVSQRTLELTKGKQQPSVVSTARRRFDFRKPNLDQDIGVLQILLFDSCRDDPFAVNPLLQTANTQETLR